MFPDNYPSYEERADLIRMEFDKRAPKIRLSIFAYLVEAGILGKGTIGTEEFLELMHKINEFISIDVEEYAQSVADLQPDETITDNQLTIIDLDTDPYGQGNAGHL